MGANIAFTLLSIRLALNYLSKPEFAIWAMVSQVVGYLALMELGMGPSVARILADHKDDRNGGVYGGVLKAGALVFLVQAAVIALAALALAPLATDLLHIEPEFRDDFIFLLRGNGLLMAFSFATKISSAPFWCFQRYDVTNYGATISFAVQLAVLWLAFSAGYGLKSMLASNAALAVFTFVWTVLGGISLGMYPRMGAWGRIEKRTLHGLFGFGRDIFLMAIGAQLLSASQLIIIGRTLGLDAAATWALCSKVFTLAQQSGGKSL